MHKPGIVALRPLGLGDLYDGAFRAIRHNAGATVGASVLVAALAMAIPVLVTTVLGATGGLASGLSGDPTDAGSAASTAAAALAFGSLGLATLLQGLGTILVTAMVARVVGAAVVGRTMTLAEAWAETRGRRWRLLGLAALLAIGFTLLIGAYVLAWVLLAFAADLVVLLLFGLVSVPAFLALLVWLWVRVALLPATVLSLENVSVLGAIARGRRLTLGHFWRVLGIALLTVVITQVVGGVLSIPVGIVGEVVLLAVDPSYEVVVLVLSQAVATVVAAAFVTPFMTAVTALQYVDLRIRQEAFDVELLARTRPAAR
ncbi:hypothetical protein GHK92_02185 [Nocardioides sp. dk4132]|uniref:hypothetical protein n=1 Tax=unclassified Nocardioides TaxID=2615069 RepID=UPI001297E65F|nr:MULTISPECIES: hypothetical protein [unclassified Nocardioides]MQW74671.1 hypothetical protein [Nocardioides sp. dk4132]QGA06578.1 hypothetical protein GFH29_03625 [Nocardioides sp. dk884]